MENSSENIFTVTELNSYVDFCIKNDEFLWDISLMGEISDYSERREIIYFTIKDETSSVNCIKFGISKTEKFNVGDKVILKGSAQFYAKNGSFSFKVRKMEKYGLGQLYENFLKLKKELEAKGYFEESRKKSFPTSINTIGVVTSSEGAVIQDIRNVVSRRNPNIKIFLYDAKVQGENASEEIAKGIDFFNNFDVDALIVARGGGSLSDLEPFNNAIVAESAFNSNKYLVSAIGHETNFSILDFVADLRVPTPSAAAEVLVKDSKNLSELTQKTCLNLLTNYKKFISNFENEIRTKYSNIYNQFKMEILKNENKINSCLSIIQNTSPVQTMKRGFSIIEENGVRKRKVEEIEIGANIDVFMSDGNLQAQVISKNKESGKNGRRK